MQGDEDRRQRQSERKEIGRQMPRLEGLIHRSTASDSQSMAPETNNSFTIQSHHQKDIGGLEGRSGGNFLLIFWAISLGELVVHQSRM